MGVGHHSLESCIGLDLAGMLRGVRRRIAALQTDVNGADVVDSFWTDEDIIDYLVEAYEWCIQVLALNGEGEFQDAFTFDFVANQRLYILPADCIRVERLLRAYQGSFVPIEYSKSPTQVDAEGSSAVSMAQYTYSLHGMDIAISPVPTTDEKGALKLEYIKIPGMIKKTGEDTGNRPSRQFLPFWHRILVMWATAACIHQDRGDADDFEARQAKLELMLVNMSKPRTNQRNYVVPDDGSDDWGVEGHFGWGN